MTRDYTGRLLAIADNGEVDLKLYLMADAGFGIRLYAGVYERRFKMLESFSEKAMEYLAEHCMNRNILVRVIKTMTNNPDYYVELIDANTGVNHSEFIVHAGL